MTSVERVLEYGKLKSEAALRRPRETENQKLPKNRSSKVVLEFRDVSMRYADEDQLVLKNLNFKIFRGEKARDFILFSKYKHLRRCQCR